MLDIKKIKENPDAVKAGLRAKEVDCAFWSWTAKSAP